TEEACFPVIMVEALGQSLHGTTVLGMRDTGAFEAKHPRLIFDIYKRLAGGKSLLPPSIGFIFDREDRSDRDRAELESESDGLVRFTSRKMFENFLLNAEAIAHVLNELDTERNAPVSHRDVEQWIDEHRWDDRY